MHFKDTPRWYSAGKNWGENQQHHFYYRYFWFPFSVTNASLSPWLLFQLHFKTPICLSHSTLQVIFCQLKAEISSYFVLMCLWWRPVACHEGEVSSWCLKSSKPRSGQWRKCMLRHEGTQPWFVVHSVIEPCEQRPLHSGWGEGGVGDVGARGVRDSYWFIHVERALTDFALKRQASFLTTHHNNATLVSRANTR